MGVGYITGQRQSGGFPLGWKEEVSRTVVDGNITKYDAVLVSKHSWDERNTKLTDTSVPPHIAPDQIAITNDGSFIAMSVLSSSPYLYLYRRNGATFSKVANPTVMPGGQAVSCCFSPDGSYLAVSHNQYSTIKVSIYKYSGGAIPFEKIADIPLPEVMLYGLKFSPDGKYLIGVGGSSPYPIKVYSRTGDAFTLLSGSLELPYPADSLDFSSDGKYLAVIATYYDALKVYTFNGGVLTPLTTLSAEGNVCFSKDGRYVAAVTGTSGVDIFKRIDNAFSFYKNLPTDGGGARFISATFSSDGAYLFVTCSVSPWVVRYKINGGNFMKLGNLSTIPASALRCAIAKLDDLTFASIQSTTPFFNVYTTTVTNDVSPLKSLLSLDLEKISTVDLIGIAKETKTIGQSLKVNLFPNLNTY